MVDTIPVLALSRGGGFTLIEAVAAVAICATAVVALLGVRHRLIQDVVRCERLAEANVLAGDLAAQWRLGQMRVDPHEKRTGRDDEFGMSYELACEPRELPDGTFMNRLMIRVYVDDRERALVDLEVWRRLGG